MGSKKSSSASDDITAEIAATESEPRPVTASLEAWGLAAGHLPMWLQESTVGARMNPAYWKFAATKALMGWEDGTQMTRAEYEAAVAKQDSVRHG
jgi:hypothetical protein